MHIFGGTVFGPHQVAPEVEVEPTKVQLPEVPPVVHVAEIVHVRGGADGVDDALAAGLHVDAGKEEPLKAQM